MAVTTGVISLFRSAFLHRGLARVHRIACCVALSSMAASAFATDTLSWQTVGDTVPVNGVATPVVFGKGLFLAGGRTSLDGLVWQADGFTIPASSYVVAAYFVHDRFFFVETDLKAGATATLRSIYVSLDGKTGRKIFTATGLDERFAAPLYDGNRFLIPASGGTLVSQNGDVWSRDATLDLYPGPVAFGNGVFVKIVHPDTPSDYSDQDTLQTSTDGMHWQISYTAEADDYVGRYVTRLTDVINTTKGLLAISRHSIHYGGVGGTYGTSVRSANGHDWIHKNGVGFLGGSGPINESNGIIAVIQSNRYLPETTMAVSIDGDVWFELGMGNELAVDGLAGANGIFVASAGNVLLRAVLPTLTPPSISEQPKNVTLTRNQYTTLKVGPAGLPPFSYQWRVNGAAITGETGPTLLLGANGTQNAGGIYDVVVSSIGGSVTSVPARIDVKDSWLSNLSSRAYAGTNDDAVVQGFVGEGGSADVLIRAAGPALAAYGLSDFLADPQLKLFLEDGKLYAQNDNWAEPASNEQPYRTKFSTLGAFPFASGSADAALSAGPFSPTCTVKVTDTKGRSGQVLTEIYDQGRNGRLLNLSARARVGSGDHALIGGFVIAGGRPLTVLIRGIGPTLIRYGVQGALMKPRLSVFDAKGALLATSESWSRPADQATLRSAAATVGAFALDDGSADAALLLTLEPGVYSAQITSPSGVSGIALAEIYAMPPAQ